MKTVHIELQRVQTWLFAVPRLLAMVGANTLLGETLRIELRNLATKTNRGWKLAPLVGDYPPADPNDPLPKLDGKDADNPAEDAKDGILSRDGGHFEAQFREGAELFAEAAADILRENLPDLRFQLSIDGVKLPTSHTHISKELPVLMPCEWAGRGLASSLVNQGTETAAVSLEIAKRHDAAIKAKKNKARDLASLLSAATLLSRCEQPEELKQLVGDGYLALIHADGNGVGEGATRARTGGDPADDNGRMVDHAKRARFFFENRVLLRRALKTAIDTHTPPTGNAPLVPLMLGGDDILLVCRAEIALPFVVTLCDTLAELQKDNTGFRLTLGVGVVIAKHSIPIHRLHEVAEQLAGSAKRRVRGLVNTKQDRRSVIDWAVYSSSWVDDPEEIRRRDWIRGTDADRRILSNRPLDVLGEDLGTLAGLLQGAEALKVAPRSQLRYLVDQLPRGRTLSELAYAELSAETNAALKKAKVKQVWAKRGAISTTHLLDLVEVHEIAKLGTSAQTAIDAEETEEVVHGG